MLHMVITTSPLVKTYTLQEFWHLPEPADHSKLELIKGVLYMTPRPTIHTTVRLQTSTNFLWKRSNGEGIPVESFCRELRSG